MSATEFRSRAQRYVALRRALGYQARPFEKLVFDFVAFVESRGLADGVTAQTALDWACGPYAEGHRNRAARLGVARGLLVYVRASDPRTEVPPVGLLRRPDRPAPHIFSDGEIAALVRIARGLGPTGSLRPHTYSTLIGLLASCGLRISEATGLRLDDVRLAPDSPHLHVAESKFHKSRLVALHPTVVAALQAYATERRRLGYHLVVDAFFVSETLGPLHAGSARRTFTAIARRAGVRPPTGPGAHLHDLRHTFAVRRVLLWYQEGVDVHARMPELSVYLGHVRPADTYWYLSATPQLLACAANRFEGFADVGGEP
jgi:integrase/recombinase XerD